MLFRIILTTRRVVITEVETLMEGHRKAMELQEEAEKDLRAGEAIIGNVSSPVDPPPMAKPNGA